MTRPRAPWITITGLDGSGKTTLLRALSQELGGFQFRLPYHRFVREFLNLSGGGSAFGDVHTDYAAFSFVVTNENQFNPPIGANVAQYELLDCSMY